MGSVPSLQTRVEGRSAGFTAQPAEAQLSRVPLRCLFLAQTTDKNEALQRPG